MTGKKPSNWAAATQKYLGCQVLYLPASVKEQALVEVDLRRRIAAELPAFSQVKVKYVPDRTALAAQGQVGGVRIGCWVTARAGYGTRKAWLGAVIGRLRQMATRRGIET